jgi:hypothetical protein
MKIQGFQPWMTKGEVLAGSDDSFFSRWRSSFVLR